MKATRIGVVGCGVMGVRHLQAIEGSDRAVAFAVADTVPERATAAARASGAGKVYRDGEELIRDPDVDAVIFSTPAAFRDELAIEALRLGKHVLLEKPAGMNASVVRRMIDARGDRVAACCSGRFHAYRSAGIAAEFVASGVLGPLRMLYCRVHEAAAGVPATPPPAWRLNRGMNGGGILLNWGSYDLDYLFGVTGWKVVPEVVLAQTWRVPPRSAPNVAPDSDAETHVSFFARCRNEIVISYERGEYMPAHGQRQWQIVGTHGSLSLTMLYEDDKVIIHDDTSTETGVSSHEIWRGNDRWADMQGVIVRDFVDAVAENREPQTSLEKALIIQKLTDAVYESAARGDAVRIE